MRSRVAAVLAAVVLATGACGDDDDPADPGHPTDADVEGRAFTSTEVEGLTLVAGTEITLAFEAGRLAVDAGCNAMTAGFAIDDGTLEVEGFASTLMGCPDDRARQDAAVQDFLAGGPAMTLDGDVLTLTGQGITLTAREQP